MKGELSCREEIERDLQDKAQEREGAQVIVPGLTCREPGTSVPGVDWGEASAGVVECAGLIRPLACLKTNLLGMGEASVVVVECIGLIRPMGCLTINQ